MPLISSAIVAICLSSQGQYNAACNRGLEAAARQTGVYSDFENAENKVNGIVRRETEYVIGQKAMSATGTVFYVVKVVKDRSISFPLPTLGLCDSISNTVGQQSYDMHVQWKF